MNPKLFASLLTLASLATLATPANAQRLEGAAVDFGGVLIPIDQAKPPAGSPWLAFRPACHQLVGEVQPTGEVYWGVPMPDGRMGWLAAHPLIPEAEAREAMAASGTCKFGTTADGVVDVPFVYTKDVPATAVATPTATPVSALVTTPAEDSPTGGLPCPLVIASGVGMAAIAGAGLALFNRSNPPTKTDSTNEDYDLFEDI